MRHSAWVLAAVLAVGTSTLSAETLTSEQQASLDRLKQELWDQGYSDSEIQVEVDRKRAEFTGSKPAPIPARVEPVKPFPAQPSAEDPALSRLLGEIRELVDARVMAPEKSEEVQAKATSSWKDAAPAERATLLKNMRRTLKWAVVEAWRKELIKAGTDKGMPFLKARLAAADTLNQKGRQLSEAQAYLRKQGFLGEALLEKLKAKFPAVPSVFFEAEDDEQSPPPPKETPVTPAFSDDEIDEIVDTMLEELDQVP